MLSLEVIVILGVLFGLAVYAMVVTQHDRRALKIASERARGVEQAARMEW